MAYFAAHVNASKEVNKKQSIQALNQTTQDAIEKRPIHNFLA